METRSAFISIVGKPNVGKSTLLNSFVGEKVAIISNKPQTTRNRITGIITREDTQFVFIDTPGWHKSRNRLDDFMLKEIKSSLADVDLVLMVTDPFGETTEEENELLNTLKLRNLPAILVMNKIDMLKQKEQMMPKIEKFSAQYDFRDIVPISAKNGMGTQELFDLVGAYASKGPHYFDADDFTDQPERVIISEIIREKLLRYLWEELPHGVAVGIESMKDRKNTQKETVIDIQAVIFCERDSHKGMIIGKNGEMLKKIGTAARKDIERFMGCKINLKLWVKVKEDWRNRDNLMKQFGFSD